MRRLFLSLLLLLLPALPAAAGTQTNSSTAVSTFLTWAKSEINDDSGGFFTDAEAIRWINDAVYSIASQARCLEASENATIYTGQIVYSISTSHYDIETVLYDSGDAADPQRYTFLDKIDPKSAYTLNKEKGRPKYWWEWENTLNVWPAPGSDQNATTVQMFLIEKPGAISATTDEIPLPYYFDNAIRLYMRVKFYEKDEKPASANYYRGLFNNEVSLYRNEVRSKLVTTEAQ